MISEDKLASVLSRFSVEPEARKVSRLGLFIKRLTERNAVMNLTAITDADEILTKHIADSLSALSIKIDEGASVIDIGTGAGFPGMVLKITRPDLRLCLIDSLGKRVSFLQETIAELGLDGIEALHARAEELAHNGQYRESFDVAVSRAVAALPALCEYCLPFVKTGGRFAAMKGNDSLSELSDSLPAIDALGASLCDQISVTLPGSDAGRHIIVIEKLRPTAPKYPRKQASISKKRIK